MKFIYLFRYSAFTLALLAASQIAIAQNSPLKAKKVTLSDNSKVTYHVNEQNIKEGPYYIRNAKSDQLLLKGAYTNNERSGNWYFYDETGKPESVYSYQQNKLAFIAPGLLNKLTINIPDQEKEVAENTRIPVLLSPMRLFLSEISNSITIPEEHFNPGEALPIRIKSEIEEGGNSKYFISYIYNGKNIVREIRLKSTAFSIEWIPAQYNSKPVRSEVIIHTAINLNTDPDDGHRRFRWN